MPCVILHADANSFYATVEYVYRPETQGRPLSVCGAPEKRHGIVLASNQLLRQDVEIIHDVKNDADCRGEVFVL